jgi:flagellar biogenesis protein FliO
MGYLSNFIVYTLAMVGVMMIALFVFKKSMNQSCHAGSKYLKVIDSISLGPRKNLYIVSVGDEKFLIAGDAERTNLISKLVGRKNVETTPDSPVIPPLHIERKLNSDSMDRKEILSSLFNTKNNQVTETSNIGIYNTNTTPYATVMKNLAEKMKERV